MTKYIDFVEAYRKAYPQMNTKMQWEKANELWRDLKSTPENFEEKYKKKMSELKYLRAKNNSQSLKTFTQATINFGRITVPNSTQASKSSDQNLPSTSGYVEYQMEQKSSLLECKRINTNLLFQ